LFKTILVLIPQLGDAINWMNEHVKSYRIERRDNKIVVTIDVDTFDNARRVEPYLYEFMELLFENKRCCKH